jgi:RHS repeat-associated protein
LDLEHMRPPKYSYITRSEIYLNHNLPTNFFEEPNFDILDRLSNIKQADNEIANFKYIGRSYRLLSKQFGNNDVVNYLYDQGRRMTSKEARNKNSDLINHYKHSYNKVHMKNYEQRMHENGIGDVFGYDAVYRLTSAKFNVPDPTAANPTDFERERNIFLDHLDNITRIDETKNGETTQITTEIPPDTDFLKLNQYSRFDQWGLGYDKNGNLTQKGTQKMYHDYRSQMVRVTEGTTTTENKYDALGRRLQKIVNTGSQSETENYYYSGHQVIEVRDGNDQVKRQFIYGNGIDEVVRMDAYSGSTITPYYFHTNAIGSTTAVTDANGNVVERYKYGLYGMPTFMDAAGNVIPKSAIGNNILFQGREYEPETNFYYFRARHLDPIMGRFLSTDPMGYQDSLNLYQAFNMNPVNFLDPFGEAVRPGVEPEVVKSAYVQFIQSGDSPDTALRKLEEYGYIDSEIGYKLALVSSTHAEPGAQVLGTAAYVMFEFSPAGVFKDAVSLPFGKDLVSGEKLKWWQKALIATPFLAKAYKIYKARNIAKVADVFETGTDISKLNNAEKAGKKSLLNPPFEYADDLGPNTLGATNARTGEIYIKAGLKGEKLTKTIRHEAVHKILTPKVGKFLSKLRSTLRIKGYEHSHLLRYLEEALAEAVGTKNILKVLKYPLKGGYDINKVRLLIEGGALTTAYGLIWYFADKLANQED